MRTETARPQADVSNLMVREISTALRDLCRVVAEVETDLARGLGLSAGEYKAVKHVLYTRRPLCVTDLARHLGYSKGTTSELVVRLERRGFVAREPNGADARRLALRATDDAVAHVHETLGAMFSALAGVASTKDAATLRSITSFLREAAAAVGPAQPSLTTRA